MADTRSVFTRVFNEIADEQLVQQVVENQKDPNRRSLRPTVVICLGGSGCEIGARLRTKLDDYYHGVRAQTGIDPLQMIQFLAFDTVEYELQQSEALKESFSNGQGYQFLGGFAPSEYIRYNMNEDLKRWWDERYPASASSIRDGASRVRQLGRLCLYYHRNTVLNKLKTAIQTALSLNTNAVASGQLAAMPTANSNTPQCMFYIISGCCGGTGSGTFVDMTHLILKAAADFAMRIPPIRAMVLMPTLHIGLAESVMHSLGAAYRANTYAFFKEVQYFQFPDGRDRLYHDCFEANELKSKNMSQPYGNWRAWDRMYLLDNVVGNQVLPSLKDVYGLGSETLFHLMALPTGFQEEGAAVTNVNFDLPRDGRPVAISSMGVSHIVYPAKTIARKALSVYLENLHDYLLRPLEETFCDDGKGKPKNMADEVAAAIKGLRATTLSLRVEELEKEWTNCALPLSSQIQTKKLLSSTFTKKGGKAVIPVIAQERQHLVNLIAQARAVMQQQYNTTVPERLREAKLAVESLINSYSGTASIAFTKSLMKALLAEMQTVSENYAAVQADAGVASCFQRVETAVGKLARDLWPDKIQAEKFEAHFSTAQTEAMQLFGAVVKQEAFRLTRQYLESLLGQLKEITTRSEQLELALKTLSNELQDSATFLGVEADEGTLPVTTQYLPPKCLDSEAGAHLDLVKIMEEDIQGDVRALLAKFATDGFSLLDLANNDEVGRRTASERYLRTIISSVIANEQALTDRLTMTLRDAAQQCWDNLKKAPFKDTLQWNSHQLAKPPIALDLTRAQLQQTDLAQYLSVGLPAEYVGAAALLHPEEIHAALSVSGSQTVMDNRRISILRTQHGFPLHAVNALSVYRPDYDKAMADLRNGDSADVPHSSKEYHYEMKLPDIPPSDDAKIRSFALASFTDWLQQEEEGESEMKRDARAKLAGLVADHPRGVVFNKGNLYYLAQFEAARGRARAQKSPLLLTGTIPLNPGSKGALRGAFDTFAGIDHEGSVALYLEYLDSAISRDAKLALLDDYQDYLLKRKREMEKKQPASAAVYQMQLDALKKYADEMA
ncbi:MAG: tubulin-like doman-containing protein [Armatimonadota bacterium]